MFGSRVVCELITDVMGKWQMVMVILPLCICSPILPPCFLFMSEKDEGGKEFRSELGCMRISWKYIGKDFECMRMSVQWMLLFFFFFYGRKSSYI